jgi:hypothetical protein
VCQRLVKTEDVAPGAGDGEVLAKGLDDDGQADAGIGAVLTGEAGDGGLKDGGCFFEDVEAVVEACRVPDGAGDESQLHVSDRVVKGVALTEVQRG